MESNKYLTKKEAKEMLSAKKMDYEPTEYNKVTMYEAANDFLLELREIFKDENKMLV